MKKSKLRKGSTGQDLRDKAFERAGLLSSIEVSYRQRDLGQVA